MDSFAIDCSAVFRTIDSCSVVGVVCDLPVDDFLGGQIVGDLNMTNLLTVHDVFEAVDLYRDHFFFLLAIEIDIDHGIDRHVFLVVESVFVRVYV